MHDDGGHGRLDPVENASHHRHFAPGQVDPRQADQDEQRRQHEQGASNHPAPGAVHQPADVGGQLLGLWARQQHAVVEGMQKAPLADPAAPLDQLLMHDRNLPRRAAETDEAQLQPEQQGLGQADVTTRLLGGALLVFRHFFPLVLSRPQRAVA
ncbi:hypothetical protein D3C80_1697650 [compost metagenome]